MIIHINLNENILKGLGTMDNNQKHIIIQNFNQ